MNWENTDTDFEEEKETGQGIYADKLLMQKKEETQLQLQGFKDPSKDPQRQAYLTLINQIEDHLSNNRVEEIAREFFLENTQIFVFHATKGIPVEYSNGPKGFTDLHQNRNVLEREVCERYVDLEQNTAIQICRSKIQNKNATEAEEEFSIELFTFQTDKISKYRVSYSFLCPAHNGEDPFVPTKKDQMMAKVKLINIAFTDHPDLDKVASLFDENTEYQILSWDGETFCTLTKAKFASDFRQLEEKMCIKCIVPYDLYTEGNVVIGTYVYYLEEKATGNSFIWLSTSAYVFDDGLVLIRISQQGELSPENETEIPFEFQSRQKILETTKEFFNILNPNLDVFYHNLIHFDCVIHRFGPYDLPNTRNFHGLDEIMQLFASLTRPEADIEWLRPIDIYIDQQAPSYDVAVLVVGLQAVMHYEGYKYKDKLINWLNIVRFAFENKKLTKILHFFSEVPYLIPSPFDDKNAKGINFKPLEE